MRAPEDGVGYRVLHNADFRYAVVPAEASFAGVRFDGLALFREAHFQGDTAFHGATFQGDAEFDRASFEGEAWFDGATFQRDAAFGGTTFKSGASFSEATFQGAAHFLGAGLQDDAAFSQAIFQSSASFAEATFRGAAQFDGASFQGDAQFDGASFQGDATFRRASFRVAAQFSSVSFQGTALFGDVSFQDAIRFSWADPDPVLFDGASFQAEALFGRARFQCPAAFRGATFRRDAAFGGVTFYRNAIFDRAGFQGDAEFARAGFRGDASFRGTPFGGDVRFGRAGFRVDARFDRASFQGDVRFDLAAFRGDASFHEASFERPLATSLLAAGTCSLDAVLFPKAVQLTVAACFLSLQGSAFPAGGHLRVASAEVTLEEAELPAPFILSAHRLASDAAARWGELAGSQVAARAPRLVSVQRANVAGLVLTGVNLAACHFAGAHHLDQLQVTTADSFYRVRAGRFGGGRQVLAEECAWRRTQPLSPGRRRWQATASLSSSPFLVGAYQPDAAELAGLYRQLRKGREEAKNEPGAADFYYGEMEMRRYAASTSWAERRVLETYWLISGYALRAWRALTTLLVVLALATALIVLWGLPEHEPRAGAVGTITGQRVMLVYRSPQPSVPRTALRDRWSWERAGKAIWISTNAAVFRTADQQLTAPGKVTEMSMRILGPLLLALAVLSIRNRVKR
jgi:hypothetical protein